MPKSMFKVAAFWHYRQLLRLNSTETDHHKGVLSPTLRSYSMDEWMDEWMNDGANPGGWHGVPRLSWGFGVISPFIVQGVPRWRVERRKPWRACLLRLPIETFKLQKDEKKISVDEPCLWHLSSRYYSATFSVELTFFAELFCNRLKLEASVAFWSRNWRLKIEWLIDI